MDSLQGNGLIGIERAAALHLLPDGLNQRFDAGLLGVGDDVGAVEPDLHVAHEIGEGLGRAVEDLARPHALERLREVDTQAGFFQDVE